MAFTRTGPLNARTCPVKARVSISLIHSTCQAGSSSGKSTLEVWDAVQLMAWVSLALYVTQLALSILTTQYWLSEPLRRGQRPQLQSSLQIKFNLHSLRKFKFKFTGMFKFKFKFKFTGSFKPESANLRYVHWQPGVRQGQRHVPVICTQTGCRPDLELSCRRYCILFDAAARLCHGDALCGPSTEARRSPPKPGQERTQEQFEMLFLLAAAMMFAKRKLK